MTARFSSFFVRVRRQPAFMLFLLWSMCLAFFLMTPDKEDEIASGKDRLKPRRPRYTILGYSDLGMHCMNQNFSEICILPPFSTMRAQVIDRYAEHPRIVSNGLKVEYSIPNNTISSTKTNFWEFAPDLFGFNLPLDEGLTGSKLAGKMVPSGNRDWIAVGIPLTPLNDDFENDPFQLSEIVINGPRDQMVAKTVAVAPVSWEISCNLCHNTPGISVETDILRKHDQIHGTQLEQAKPVLCADCHGDPALGAPGDPKVSMFSHAMHSSHADRMSALPNLQNTCYACHPGVQTECQRDVHLAKGITCTNCHGNMLTVGDTERLPWVDEPTCAECHQSRKPKFDFEEPGKLFKDSKGHGGVFCAACHGPQHAITPAVTPADNAQAILQQGVAGVIRDCTVCHLRKPGDPFFHSRDDD